MTWSRSRAAWAAPVLASYGPDISDALGLKVPATLLARADEVIQ